MELLSATSIIFQLIDTDPTTYALVVSNLVALSQRDPLPDLALELFLQVFSVEELSHLAHPGNPNRASLVGGSYGWCWGGVQKGSLMLVKVELKLILHKGGGYEDWCEFMLGVG